MADKVTLTPYGLSVYQWNAETDSIEDELLEQNDPSVISHLRTYCEIDPDTTLWNIMDFVRKNEALTLFISQYAWVNSIDAFHAELDKPPIIDENDKMDHLEIHWSTEYQKSKKYNNFGMAPDFHGVALPVTEENQAAIHEENGYELPVGFVETYSVSGSPLNQFTHLKLILNTDVNIYRLKRYPDSQNIKILSSECQFSLLDILDAIYWDISFYGPPDQRDGLVDDLKQQIEDVDVVDGTIMLLDDLFEELSIPPQTEEDDIEDDNTDPGEWDIEI